MTEAARIADFGAAIRTSKGDFDREELLHRTAAGTNPVDEEQANVILERNTRRFLVDPMLRALGWDLDNPNVVVEEARSWSNSGDRLYFDYLGTSNEGMATLLVEAKGVDADAPRPPRVSGVSRESMAVLISQALNALKNGDTPTAVLREWSDWLEDLRQYVLSLDTQNRQTLRRVVITAGRWLIIFKEPLLSFVDRGEPDTESIQCYTSFDEIIDRHSEVYRLLARQRLVDTLPLTLPLGEALAILRPEAITQLFQGVVVATRTSGGARIPFPTRAVYNAIVVVTANRIFAITNYHANPLVEPTTESFPAFLDALSIQGNTFKDRVLRQLGRNDIEVSPIEDFPLSIRSPRFADTPSVIAGSTVELEDALNVIRPELVRLTGERGAENEYLIVTGEQWFYKTTGPFGNACSFHSFPASRSEPGGNVVGKFNRTLNGFTVSADPQHCENADIRGLRESRCQMDRIESHLCCRSCIFHVICWGADDLRRLPCPS